MKNTVFELPYPSRDMPHTDFGWWEDKPPTQDSMDNHILFHIFDEGVRKDLGIPLYDLEVCAARQIRLNKANGFLISMLDNPQTKSFAANTLLAGGYLGVFGKETLEHEVFNDFVGQPYAGGSSDYTFVQDLQRLSDGSINPSKRLPYDNNAMIAATILCPDFTPPIFQIASKAA